MLKKNGLVLFLCLLPLFVFYGFNHENVPLKFSLILGLLTFPYVLQAKNHPGGYRYAVLAMFACCGLLFFRSSSLYYFATIFILFFIIDNWWGKLNALPLILALAISPISSTMVYLWSFPIRLKLSHLAAVTLQQIGMDITAQGNVLTMNGSTFSVDPACIGLKMITTSLVLGLVILAYFEKKHNRWLSIYMTSALLLIILVSAVIANFIRLLTLIVFHILPENPLHDAVGILVLIVYILIPFFFFSAYLFKKKPPVNLTSKGQFKLQPSIPKTKKVFLVLLMFLLVFTGFQFQNKPNNTHNELAQISLDGFERSITKNGILKFQNSDVLIYVKAPVRFFQGSHDPRICWKGSGYVFSSIQIENIHGKNYYTAILKKGSEELHTAWWYQGKKERLIMEWDWRSRNLLHDDQFYLINVTCLTKQHLTQSIKQATKLSIIE